MEVHLSPEIEARLVDSAARLGRNTDELLQDVVSRHFEAEPLFVEIVERGEESLRRGDYLTHEEVGVRLSRFLRG